MCAAAPQLLAARLGSLAQRSARGRGVGGPLEHHKPTRTKCLNVKAGEQIVQRVTLRAPVHRTYSRRGCQWLVAFAVLGVDDSSSKVPLLLAYSPVARTRERRANQNPKGRADTSARPSSARRYRPASVLRPLARPRSHRLKQASLRDYVAGRRPGHTTKYYSRLRARRRRSPPPSRRPYPSRPGSRPASAASPTLNYLRSDPRFGRRGAARRRPGGPAPRGPACAAWPASGTSRRGPPYNHFVMKQAWDSRTTESRRSIVGEA